jgi:hypothetical protein
MTIRGVQNKNNENVSWLGLLWVIMVKYFFKEFIIKFLRENYFTVRATLCNM